MTESQSPRAHQAEELRIRAAGRIRSLELWEIFGFTVAGALLILASVGLVIGLTAFAPSAWAAAVEVAVLGSPLALLVAGVVTLAAWRRRTARITTPSR